MISNVQMILIKEGTRKLEWEGWVRDWVKAD